MKTIRTLEERLESRLGPKDPITGCIEWMGGRIEFGHGRIWRDGRQDYAHRVAWELKHGPIPEGMQVCHECDNPPCCNTDHLFLGTQADNMADRDLKGRGGCGKGSAHGMAKLSEESIKKIRVLLGTKKQKQIAVDFGVSEATISNIKRGIQWTHVA